MEKFDLECEIHSLLELNSSRNHKFNPELETELRSMFDKLRADDLDGMEARLAEIKAEIKAAAYRSWTGGYSARMSDRDYY